MGSVLLELGRGTDGLTFDVLDRKQARRTGMAGPLGEMFDHGVCCPFPGATPSLTFAQDAMLLIPLYA